MFAAAGNVCSLVCGFAIRAAILIAFGRDAAAEFVSAFVFLGICHGDFQLLWHERLPPTDFTRTT
jgi:hypothetical protein